MEKKKLLVFGIALLFALVCFASTAFGGSMTVHGTEYVAGQMVKVWLQLLNDSGNNVDNGVCYTNIYAPDNDIYLSEASMIPMYYDGVYYYDLFAPLIEGVYPVTAKCYYGSYISEFFPRSFNMSTGINVTTVAYDNFECNGFNCGSGWNAAWSYSGGCSIISTGSPFGTYHMRGQSACDVIRRFNDKDYNNVTISFYAKSASLEATEYCRYYYYYDGSTYTELMSMTDGADDDVYRFYSYDVASYGTSTLAGIRMVGGPSSGDYCYIDNINITGRTDLNLHNLVDEDGVAMSFLEQSIGGVSHINISFSVNNGTTTNLNISSCLNISESLMFGLNVYVRGKFSSVSNDDITLSIYNFSGNKWNELPNKLLQGSSYDSVSNFISFNNLSSSGYYQNGTGVKVRLTDSNYADSVDSLLFLDKLSVGCQQANSPVWQEVMGSSEIHVSSAGEYSFTFYSLCGEHGGSECAEFRYDNDYWNFTWGYIFENLTFINSYQTDVESTYVYETQVGQDCTAIIDVLIDSERVLDTVVYSAGDKENCRIEIPVVFDSEDREFNIVITQDNYMVWEMQRAKDFALYFELSTAKFCDAIAVSNDNPYEIPIDVIEKDISTLYADNPIYLNCYRAMDDLYWFNYYYNYSLAIGTSGEYEAYLLEERFYFPELRIALQVLQDMASELLPYLYGIETLCGTREDYGCAKVMPPDAYFTSQEGYIIENLTVTNTFFAALSSEYVYETAGGIDCTAVMEILRESDGVGTADLYNDTLFRVGSNNNCVLTLPIEFLANETSSNIIIYMENYILWDIQWARDLINNLNDTIVPYCENVALANNMTYVLPIDSDIEEYRNNSDIYFCYRAVDDLYWWWFFYDSLAAENYSTIGPLESIHYESEYFWPRIVDDYNVIESHKSESYQLSILSVVSSILEYVQNIYAKLFGIELSVNQTLNNTLLLLDRSNQILAKLDNLTVGSVSVNQTEVLESISDLNQTISGEILTNLQFTGGTEYEPGQDGAGNGKAVVQFFQGSNPLVNKTVQVKLWYPNQTIYIDWSNMTYLEDGIYYYDFIVPWSRGVYTLSAKGVNGGNTYYASHTFHVDKALKALMPR
jgi:hypothetical protein